MQTGQKKKILMLHTGGTLGMDFKGVPFSEQAFQDLLRQTIPELFQLADFLVEIPFTKDSSNIEPVDWVNLATRIHEARDSFDAFVVIHGTDTMAFSASALSFFLQGLGKPVIFTGSQRPLSDIRSDAARNLLNAVEMAVSGRIREVCIFFDSLLLRGNRAKKVSIPSFQAFESPNFKPLAQVGALTEYFEAALPAQPYRFDPRFETRVLSLPLFPGIDIDLLYALAEKNLKGFVLQAFGPGDIPLKEAHVLGFVRHLSEKGIPTVVTSQSLQGSVDLSLYETGRAARDAGALSAGNMTWETALVKMMVLLGRGHHEREPFSRLFLKNLVGEIGD